MRSRPTRSLIAGPRTFAMLFVFGKRSSDWLMIDWGGRRVSRNQREPAELRERSIAERRRGFSASAAPAWTSVRWRCRPRASLTALVLAAPEMGLTLTVLRWATPSGRPRIRSILRNAEGAVNNSCPYR